MLCSDYARKTSTSTLFLHQHTRIELQHWFCSAVSSTSSCSMFDRDSNLPFIICHTILISQLHLLLFLCFPKQVRMLLLIIQLLSAGYQILVYPIASFNSRGWSTDSYPPIIISALFIVSPNSIDSFIFLFTITNYWMIAHYRLRLASPIRTSEEQGISNRTERQRALRPLPSRKTILIMVPRKDRPCNFGLSNLSGDLVSKPHEKAGVFSSQFDSNSILPSYSTLQVLFLPLSFFFCLISALGKSAKQWVLRTFSNHPIRMIFHPSSLKCVSLKWLLF